MTRGGRTKQPSLRSLQWAMGLLVAGFVLLIASVASFAASQKTLGVVFMIAMLGCGVLAISAAFASWMRARRWRDQQRSDVRYLRS